jgi:uncharacterized ion transporter superfamily protein YfcC
MRVYYAHSISNKKRKKMKNVSKFMILCSVVALLCVGEYIVLRANYDQKPENMQNMQEEAPTCKKRKKCPPKKSKECPPKKIKQKRTCPKRKCKNTESVEQSQQMSSESMEQDPMVVEETTYVIQEVQ